MANLTTIRYRNGSSWINLLNFVYPVGAIYISDRAVSPASLFGGTWAQITGDRFLRVSTNFNIAAASDPAHTHSGSTLYAGWSAFDGGDSYLYWPDMKPVNEKRHWNWVKWNNSERDHGQYTVKYCTPIYGSTDSTTPRITPAAQNIFAYRRTA